VLPAASAFALNVSNIFGSPFHRLVRGGVKDYRLNNSWSRIQSDKCGYKNFTQVIRNALFLYYVFRK
jgi:hypothetical protein